MADPEFRPADRFGFEEAAAPEIAERVVAENLREYGVFE